MFDNTLVATVLSATFFGCACWLVTSITCTDALANWIDGHFTLLQRNKDGGVTLELKVFIEEKRFVFISWGQGPCVKPSNNTGKKFWSNNAEYASLITYLHDVSLSRPQPLNY